jgi:RNA-directed DNA polymerase
MEGRSGVKENVMSATTSWSVDGLVGLFQSELAMSDTRGIDRLSPADMLPRIAAEAEVVSRKVRASTYKFAPYAQILKSKGARKYPREIAIPTARDRLALLRLKERLHETFPEHVPTALPNNLVRQALDAVQGANAAEKVCLRLDIQDFYGSVRHEDLLARLERRLDPFEVCLARRAIRNATVPAGSRRDAVPRTRRNLGRVSQC